MKAALAFLVLLLACGPAEAEGDRIWSALVLATKEDSPPAVPAALERFAATIRRIFGYNSLYLLGEKKRDLFSGTEDWLVPSKEFFFRVQSLSRDATFYTLRIELYREKNLLLTTETRLAKNAPLYIRGPEWGSGQLILLLEVR
jgi:hypothetical protein